MICSTCGAAHAPFGYFPPAVPRETWFCFACWPDRPADWAPPSRESQPQGNNFSVDKPQEQQQK
jgi:hypothetical protein